MSTIVGSVSVRQLEHTGITANDVRNCCKVQFGNDLLYRHNPLTDEVQFYTDRPERIFKTLDGTPILQLHGTRGTYYVALMQPCQLHTDIPKPKVVPTRSKKMLLT